MKLTYDEGSDLSLDQGVDEVRVELDSLRVDRVVASTKGNDSAPAQAEAVGPDAVGLQQGNVLAPSVVRVGGDVSISTVESLARNAGETIPDRGATATFVGGSFNLESSCGVAATDNTSKKAREPNLRAGERVQPGH